MTPETAHTKAHAASVLVETLTDIGWKEVIQPELKNYKDNLEELLVSAVLGKPVIAETAAGPCVITKEQLAGEIRGISIVEDLFARILREGAQAERYLAEMQTKYKIQ